MKYIFRLYCRTLVNGRYLSSGKTVWLRGWRTGHRRGLKVQAQTVQGSSDLSAVGLVTCTPFSTRGSAHLPSTLLRRSHHPCLSFAVLMQFVSETLAPSSLFDILARSLLWQSRVNHTVSHTGTAPQPGLSPSLSDGRRWTGNWRTPSFTLSPPPSLVRGSCLFTRIDHPTAPWRSAGYCRSFESRTSTLSSLVQTHSPTLIRHGKQYNRQPE
jgi:hypothetical protein